MEKQEGEVGRRSRRGKKERKTAGKSRMEEQEG